MRASIGDPIGRIGAARPGSNRHDRAMRIVRPVEIRRHLECVEDRLCARNRGVDVAFDSGFVAEDLERFDRLRQFPLHPGHPVDVRAHIGDLFHHRLRFGGIVPEAAAARALFEFGYLRASWQRRQSRTLSVSRRS